MREVLKDQLNLFSNNEALKAGDFTFAMEQICTYLLDFEDMEDRVLPIATLMEYVGSDITFSHEILIKARIFKGLALAELGYID
jgi:hypothetical protein